MYKIWIEACKEIGINPWLSIRMNDVHINIKDTEIRKSSLVEKYAEYWVFKNGVEVTEQYRIVFDKYDFTSESYLPIRVDKRPVTFVSESVTVKYNGETLTSSNVLILTGTLANGHTYIAKTSGSITEPGTEINAIDSIVIYEDGNDVTDNYKISRIEGLLTILPSEEE